MKKIFYLSMLSTIVLTSCVSQKKYAEMETQQKETQDLLNSATVKLNTCLEEKAAANAKAESLENQVKVLESNTQGLINNMGNLTTLTTKGAENLEKSLESLKEKDLRIQRLQDALTRKDSVTLAIVTSLKGVLGNIADEDVEVNVEKGVVFISISDKLLFKSGSYNMAAGAKPVLEKVATVVKNKPDFEFLVEGHTDNVPIKTSGIRDNWDLSVLRAASIVRVLQDDFDVKPERMTAAGRSSYVPLTSNDTEEGRSRNRRTRIVVLPKLDQFYNMVEDGMKEAAKSDK